MNRLDRDFWLLGIYEYVLGDLGTTMLGLRRGFDEAHPVSAVILDLSGVYGMLIAKTVVLGLAYILYRQSPEAWQRGVPIGLFAIGLIIVTWNMLSIQLWTVFESFSRVLTTLTDLIIT
jgi:hypothetical protein